MSKRESTKKKWLLIQARIDVSRGRELQALAESEGLPASAYLRRLVIQHLDEMKARAESGAGAPTTS